MTVQTETSTKQLLTEFIDSLPDKITLAEAIEELRIVAALQEAQVEAAAGRTVSHDEACRRMESWITK